jgi:hypothetical protein
MSNSKDQHREVRVGKPLGTITEPKKKNRYYISSGERWNRFSHLLTDDVLELSRKKV